jgi:hypothetical protein
MNACAGGRFADAIIQPPPSNPCILKASLSVRNSAYRPHTPAQRDKTCLRNDLQTMARPAGLARFLRFKKGEV